MRIFVYSFFFSVDLHTHRASLLPSFSVRFDLKFEALIGTKGQGALFKDWFAFGAGLLVSFRADS